MKNGELFILCALFFSNITVNFFYAYSSACRSTQNCTYRNMYVQKTCTHRKLYISKVDTSKTQEKMLIITHY